jgi:uncharacterized RDD family membrane protein YckC
MDCEKSDVSGCPMEPHPTEFAIPDPNSVEDAASAACSEVASAEEESSAWRDELSAKLNRYRARRKAPPPRYPSLKLPFGPLESGLRPAVLEAPVFEPVANHALALDEVQPAIHVQEPPAPNSFVETASPVRHETPHAGAKIIEFPRFAWAPLPPPPDQLAEPVMDRLRILEVPEVAPPPPALGGILIEPAQKPELEKRPGIDIPLQSAPFRMRLLASIIDGIIIALASALFGFIFWKITSIRPPQLQTIVLAGGIPCLVWAAYQYLLIVYSGTTPGLRAARLELARFDGSPARRPLRRWRVLASYLSFASLGMGYAWLFLDEDALCWHDRITHTYLAPRKTRSK